jgi:hypothetical protein
MLMDVCVDNSESKLILFSVASLREQKSVLEDFQVD